MTVYLERDGVIKQPVQLTWSVGFRRGKKEKWQEACSGDQELRRKDKRAESVSIQLDDMGMPQQLKILDFSLDTTGHITTDELLTRDDLEGDLLTGADVNSQLDLAKGTFAEGLDDLVGADTLLCFDFLADVWNAGGRAHRGHIDGGSGFDHAGRVSRRRVFAMVRRGWELFIMRPTANLRRR